ncbi:MAG: hypothetical protein AVDCRST_MAG68-3979 [uncultured Gemmatimonadetes bacterium]|uniref:UPF0145 protein AVDCRST_MAG68-3979 n=1 Tax=uncultured Gemmatimonadota bacterium TaxID=203437 RepID=A0A6J4M0K0_9BACT|nr:MAG: hypothetical protein AVDCRST_MAG68-3979 [uncultured Gemmatimonadota bacterium]
MSIQHFLGMQVTTTSSLEGWEVDSYLGPVSVHLVAGVGLFSDFFASFSDVFGGRSGAYGGELARLYSEAAEMLARKAKLLGANAVVGLRLDFDEISGGGRSMFMLNAVGTAVRVRRTVAAGAHADARADVPADEMNVMMKRHSLLEELASGKVRLTPDTWLFAMEHRIAAFGDAALGSLLVLTPDATARRTIESTAAQFFAAIEPEDAIPWLYLGLVRDKGDGPDHSLRGFCARTIHTLNLLDFGRVAALLRSGVPIERQMALQVATANPQSYGPAEIAALTALHRQIQEAFPPRWTSIHKAGFLGTAGRDAWQCPCGSQPRREDRHCAACQTDTYGLKISQADRDQVLAQIQARIGVLRVRFGEEQAAQ